MAEDRPFLLLAALAVASSNHCHLQDALIKKFKESLSERVLINGEQDLDLLQGLLVHIAWYKSTPCLPIMPLSYRHRGN
jgi:hypothetical protein